MVKFSNRKEGFTLIEILLVVALLLILASITIVAINPAKHFRDSRNAQRGSDVSEILNAVTQYTSEPDFAGWETGVLAGVVDCEDAEGNPQWSTIGTGTGEIDLDSILVEEYIIEIPDDPLSGAGYQICVTDGGRVWVNAPGAEDGKVITSRR